MMNNKEIETLTASAWREKVYIETSEHIITGYIFMPKIGKRNRLLSEVLNTGKSFIAVKECSLEYKLNPARNVENHEFMQVNISSILIMRPIEE
ncbi:MAG: hypothetical protein MJ237_07515 [bacterium]|nr:hypothetical protein [bacterium]